MSLRKPSPLIRDCILGLGIGVKQSDCGRGEIYVVKDVITPGYDGAAVRAFMEETAVRWLEQVAPHRLNYGADDR